MVLRPQYVKPGSKMGHSKWTDDAICTLNYNSSIFHALLINLHDYLCWGPCEKIDEMRNPIW